MRLLILTIAMIALTGCMTEEPDWDARIEETNKDYNELRANRKVQKGSYRLDDVIIIAKENNLELFAMKMEEELSEERQKAYFLEYLPRMEASFTQSERDNVLGSTSIGVSDGEESLRASTSTEKSFNTMKLETTLDWQDYALTQFKIANEESEAKKLRMKRVKIERELEIQVIEAFMAVASAQSLLKDTKPQLNKNELALKDISKMREQQHLNEFDLLDYKSEFLDTKKSFDEYERSYSNMCLRLTTLMGLDPSKNITLDTSLYKQKEFNEFHFPFEIPDREDIEKTALKNRAEIYESEINQYISEIESDREFLKLFPGMSLIGSYNSSSNEFLVNDDWFSASLRITTDLFRLPSKFKKYENSKLNITIQKYKKLMTSFSVTSQVRIAYENVLEVKKRLNHQEKKYKLSLDLHKLTLSAVNSGKLNKLSTIKTEIDSILSNTHRVATLSNYFVAYYRLLNTAGVPYLSPSRLSKIQPNKLTLISDKDKKAKGTFFQKLMKEEGTIEIP